MNEKGGLIIHNKKKITQRQAQALETRQKILDAAKSLFTIHGFSSTSVRMINRSINMADGLLYHYFPKGKIEIFQILAEESFSKGLLDIDNKGDFENMPLNEVIGQLLSIRDKLYTENLGILKIIIQESKAVNPNLLLLLAQAFNNRAEWLTDILRQRHAKGEIREMDFEMAANHVMAINLSNLFTKIAGCKSGLDDDQQRERIVQYILTTWKPL